MFKIIASLELSRPPPITPIFFRLPARDTQRGTPVNCGDKAKVEPDPAKLISDDPSSDAEDIDIKKWSRNQIWNT